MSTDRQARIESLRALADVLEYVPELPFPRELSRSVTGDDAQKAHSLDDLSDALTAAGVPFARSDDGHSRTITLTVGPVELRVFGVYDAAMQRHYAQYSRAAQPTKHQTEVTV